MVLWIGATLGVFGVLEMEVMLTRNSRDEGGVTATHGEGSRPDVQWETVCPKVVFAKSVSEKLIVEQAAYTTETAAIPQSPPELLPCKDWKSLYSADFTLLRKASSLQLFPSSVSLDSTGVRIVQLRV
ncbi:hypothetical protein R1sor_007792 [Riccia sorocarpa]|uniref:Uncharacterized protein n=1 Tax=Riccia sorocarpa TaxID=122646 RepID=A0ABD3HT85_9MARC